MIVAREEFEQMVLDEISNIPEEFHQRIKNVAFIVEEETSAETRRENNLSRGQDLLAFETALSVEQTEEFHRTY